ncbi:jg26041 [Pararge aegeria aegeria]|uniref:Jg26041 protein n=1 Tax=Pararge aegeria aegeria TaxID=348720 RepID=A0A8S4R1D8_9NEOP|nr:jg26041 [Pararge aegeria aegeria]
MQGLPDFASCDFFTVPELKRPLREDDDDLRRSLGLRNITTTKELKNHKNCIPKVFLKWKHRWDECLRRGR